MSATIAALSASSSRASSEKGFFDERRSPYSAAASPQREPMRPAASTMNMRSDISAACRSDVAPALSSSTA